MSDIMTQHEIEILVAATITGALAELPAGENITYFEISKRVVATLIARQVIFCPPEPTGDGFDVTPRVRSEPFPKTLVIPSDEEEDDEDEDDGELGIVAIPSELRARTLELFRRMRELGIDSIDLNASGYGDEGSIQDVTPHPAVPANVNAQPVLDEAENLYWELNSAYGHDGYWNNSGGNADMEINAVTQEIDWTHNDTYEEDHATHRVLNPLLIPADEHDLTPVAPMQLPSGTVQ